MSQPISTPTRTSKIALWQYGLIGFGLILCLYKFISGTMAKNDERLIRYSQQRWRYSYGGERYYFQSGTAERYQDADYGEFRLMPDGRVLLSGLADENKQTILIAGETPKRAAQ